MVRLRMVPAPDRFLPDSGPAGTTKSSPRLWGIDTASCTSTLTEDPGGWNETRNESLNSGTVNPAACLSTYLRSFSTATFTNLPDSSSAVLFKRAVLATEHKHKLAFPRVPRQPFLLDAKHPNDADVDGWPLASGLRMIGRGRSNRGGGPPLWVKEMPVRSGVAFSRRRLAQKGTMTASIVSVSGTVAPLTSVTRVSSMTGRKLS
jgi:hypothetical protein